MKLSKRAITAGLGAALFVSAGGLTATCKAYETLSCMDRELKYDEKVYEAELAQIREDFQAKLEALYTEKRPAFEAQQTALIKCTDDFLGAEDADTESFDRFQRCNKQAEEMDSSVSEADLEALSTETTALSEAAREKAQKGRKDARDKCWAIN